MKCELKHISLISDDELRVAWEKLGVKQQVVFHEKDVLDADAFIELARSPFSIFWLVYVGEELASMTWLNGWEHLTARVHHAFFPRFYGKAVDIAKDAIGQMFRMQRDDGQQLVKLLYGLTPATNRLAVRFAKSVGFNVVCEIPHACMVDGKSVPGVFSYLEDDNG